MLDGVHSVFHYNNPLIITSSIFFFLSFTQLNFQSKTINWFAASAFSIYLIHMNYMVKEDFRRIIRSISDQNNTFEVFGILLFIILFMMTKRLEMNGQSQDYLMGCSSLVKCDWSYNYKFTINHNIELCGHLVQRH